MNRAIELIAKVQRTRVGRGIGWFSLFVSSY